MGSVIGALFGGGASTPAAPPPPPPPPSLPVGDAAAQAQRQRAGASAGMASTIATSPTGVSGTTNTTGKQLLGS